MPRKTPQFSFQNIVVVASFLVMDLHKQEGNFYFNYVSLCVTFYAVYLNLPPRKKKITSTFAEIFINKQIQTAKPR